MRRSIRHHERAIEALAEGAYEGLGPATRRRLLARLRNELRFLNAHVEAAGA